MSTNVDKVLILNAIKFHYFLKSDAEFARFLGIKPQTLSSWYSRNTFDIDLLYSKCELIDGNYLLTGSGEMFRKAPYTFWLSNDQIKNEEKLELKTLPNNDKVYPLVNASAIGGVGNNVFAFTERDVKAYYKIPKFDHKKVDFMIEVEGSSMYPKYNSGDVVACTVIKESAFIQWNKTHVIATQEQGIIIKRIKKSNSEDSLLMISDNDSYDPFEVPKNEIIGIALVVGVIRLE